MAFRGKRVYRWLAAIALLALFWATAPQNHSEAEDVYDFAKRVEQGSFRDQAGVNRLLALPAYGIAYRAATALGWPGRAFPFMVSVNRLLAVIGIWLFWTLAGAAAASQTSQGCGSATSVKSRWPSLIPGALLLAFSYGFWRYASEAETYMLAAVLLLVAWNLAVRERWLLAAGCSALGVLVHLLNAIPLLVAIPLYHLCKGAWKRSVAHGAVAGLLAAGGYALCAGVLDWGALGAQDHSTESGLGWGNWVRGGIAFGQCTVSGNFLLGFEAFRDWLTQLFPSRMFAEEFFMAKRMPAWIPQAGMATAASLAACLFWVALRGLRLVCRRGKGRRGSNTEAPPALSLFIRTHAFELSCLAWLLLYALAVVRTESGSPELWILALIPFWLLAAPLLQGRIAWLLAGLLFIHNLVAGLLPVLPASTDYHLAKGGWVEEHTEAGDIVLLDYEPVMVFHLEYFSKAQILNTGQQSLSEIEERIGSAQGRVYALGSLFGPMESMRTRSPETYDRMVAAGRALKPRFEKIAEDRFGGIYAMTGAKGSE